MKVLFMGTPDFAVPTLEKLCECDYEVLGVYTQPDKPVGRKQILTPPDVKVCAEKFNIPVYQPISLKNPEVISEIKNLSPDVIVVVAYGKFLPVEILQIPKYGCINVHGSLLPKYRGASPIQQSVLNGDTVTGVTTMYMAEGMDTGDILLKEETEIGENETSAELFDRLAPMGAQLLIKTLEGLEKGEITPIKQDETLATYTSIIDKKICPIDWTKTNKEVHNKVRGLQTWPVAISTLNSKNIKIHSTNLCDKNGKAGEVISISPLTVACGSGSVVIKELQLEGKKRMDSKSFLLGNPLKVGDMFI